MSGWACSRVDARILTSARVSPNLLAHVNPTYGIEIAQDAAFGGTPDLIHNGTDTAEWTGSNIIGSAVIFDSTDQAHTGTKSVDCTGTVNGDVFQFKNGGGLSGYVAVTGWLYLESWSDLWNNSVSIYGYNTVTDSVVGSPVLIESYANTGILDAWQNFAIPLIDMDLIGQTIDSFRFAISSNTPGALAPDFYLDDIQLEETGGLIYKAQPDPGTWYYATHLGISYKGDLGAATQLNYSNYFNLAPLTNGIQNIIRSNGVVVESLAFKNFADWVMVNPNSRIETESINGANSLVQLVVSFPSPLILRADKGDYSEIVISDDHSGLGSNFAFLDGYTEIK